jgi:hypothetical protein
MKILLAPDGGTGGGNGAAALETLATVPGTQPRADFSAALLKMFPEDGNRTGGTPNLTDTGEGQGASEGTDEGANEGTGEGAGGTDEGANEGTGEGAGGTGDEAVVNKVLAKRVSKLLKKLEDQDQEIQELRSQRADTNTPLPDTISKLTDPTKLQALESTTRSQLKQTQHLLRQLGYAPKGVEKVLRGYVAANPALAARFQGTDAEGEAAEDYSVERMAEVLSETEVNLGETLEAIPRRQQVLLHRANVSRILREPEVAQVAAFLTDPESDGYTQVRELMNKSADLRAAPTGEALAIAAVLGMRVLNPAINKAVARMQGKGGAANGAPAKPASGKAGKLPPLPGGGGSKINGSKYKAAKANFEKNPSRANLEGVLASL